VLLLVIMLKSRYRFVLATALLIIGISLIPFIPQKWIARQETVGTYEEDASAMSRIDNWKLCWTLALDRPLTGGGFYYMRPEVFAKYGPDFLVKYRGKTWDSHNILMGMLATHGFPGLFAFLTMILFCLASCARLKRQSRGRPEFKWVYTYAEMIQLSFLAFFINGMFVNMEYFDLVYLLVAVVTAMKFVVSRELAKAEELQGNVLGESPLALAVS
jgi:probable O-glycosylation ligase (exosortase A-associated)